MDWLKSPLSFTMLNYDDGDVMRVLLRALADMTDSNIEVNTADCSSGKTPLHVSASDGDDISCKMLIKNGANVNHADLKGNTPLHKAAKNGHANVIETLLMNEAEIDARNCNGKTALHYATSIASKEIVVLLLKYGCDVNITTTYNYTPLHCLWDQLKFDELHEEIEIIIKAHINKLLAADFFVSNTNLKSVSADRCVKHLNECKHELELMKKEKIISKVTFHDILIKSPKQIFYRNKCLVKQLESDEYKSKFPNYESMIENCFRKGLKRKNLIDAGVEAFDVLTGYRLPFVATTEILRFLNDSDLASLVEAENC